MQGLLSASRSVFDRWIGWKRLGILASLTIVIIAVLHLVKTLKGIDTSAVLAALEDKSAPRHLTRQRPFCHCCRNLRLPQGALAEPMLR